MKMLMVGAIALSIVSGSVAMADPHGAGPGRGPETHDQGRHDQGDDRGDRGHGQVMEHRGWGREYGGPHHWRRGQRIGYNDWRQAPVVDYRLHHLRQPPRGYEWRESNGQYILAAAATGLIASIIINASH